jgi:hypothetical protein
MLFQVEAGLLKNLCLLLVQGGGASLLVYWFLKTTPGIWLVKQVLRVLKWTNVGESELLRYFAVLVSGCVSISVYLIMWAAFKWVALPSGPEQWGDLILASLGITYVGSQLIHGRVDLRTKDKLRQLKEMSAKSRRK